jgi:hypothetical protein
MTLSLLKDFPALSIRFAGLLLLGMATLVTDVSAQTPGLADYYRSIWFQDRAERLLSERGLRIAPLDPAHIHATSDSIRWSLDWRERAEEMRREEAARIRMRSLRSVKRLERPVYEDQFVRIPRAYYGSESMMPIDTTRTRELRARLEAEYGAPARTVHDLYDHNRRRVEDYLQFEYWFIVNDSIPLIVMDVGGPLERGLVFATHAEYRGLLPDLKRMFGRHVANLTRRDPYADHFFNELDRRWYLTGFDGRRYILRQIRQPDLRQGRPWVGSL